MRPDAYTKTILTVIAVCLIWICARDFAPVSTAQANAQQRAQRVIVTGIKLESTGAGLFDTIPVSLVNISVSKSNSLLGDNRIPVSLKEIDLDPNSGNTTLSGQSRAVLPVTINDINLPFAKFKAQQEIPVRVNTNK